MGYTSSLDRIERARVTPELIRRQKPPGFTGRSPGGPSRWSRDRESDDWEPVVPDLVVEVEYDHFTGGRFRHGGRLLRWRPDKSPEQCTLAQIPDTGAALFSLLKQAY